MYDGVDDLIEHVLRLSCIYGVNTKEWPRKFDLLYEIAKLNNRWDEIVRACDDIEPYFVCKCFDLDCDCSDEYRNKLGISRERIDSIKLEALDRLNGVDEKYYDVTEQIVIME